MALSLSISTSQGTQSVANNTTQLTVNVNISWTYGSYDHYGSSKYVTINGTTYYFSSVKINPNRTTSGSQTLYSTTVTIPHNSDGTKPVSIYASVTTATSSGTVTASRSVTLTTIPRATTPSLSASSVALGSAVTISTPRASSAFTHSLHYRIGSGSWVEIETNVGTSYSWTVPKSIANSFPSATSGILTIRCITYDDGDQVGDAKTVTLTVTIPNTAEFKPAVGTVSISEAVQAVTTAFGSRYVQGLSQLNVDIEAYGAYGSTIRSYSTSVDGVTYNSNAFTSNVINASGTLSVTVTVSDSRGRTASKTVNISVVEYKPPAITGMSYQQCNADGTANPTGTSTKISITGQVSSVSSQNSRTLTLKWKKSTDSAYQTRTLTTSDWEFTVSTIVNSTTPDETYEFVAVLEDKINTVENAVTTGIIAMSFLAGGKGVRLFGEAEDAGFWVDKIDYTITEEEYDELISLLGGGRRLISILQSFVKSGGVEGEDGGHKMALSWDGSHVIVSIDNNAATKTLLDTSMANDYVVEQGVSGGWNYEKWNSGRAKAWRKTTSSNFGTSGQVGGFYYRIYSNNIPSGIFVEITDAHADCRWGTGVSWASARNITPTKFEAIYFSNQNGGAGEFYHEVKGRWK